jgi:type II secretory pathway component PulJ
VTSGRQSGLSVVELLVAVTLFAIFLGGALAFYLVHQRAMARGQEKIEVHQNGRVALASLARELRAAGYDPGGVIPEQSVPAAIQSAESDTVTFLSDVDLDGKLDRVTYRLADARLIRETASWNGSSFSSAVSSEVADGIAALSFEYFDDATPDNESIPTPVGRDDLERVRRVTLGLVARRPSTADSDETFVLETDVTFRNLR